MDTLTREERSERMSRVRSKNTAPELAVQRLVHAPGYCFRLHRRDLPGSPDLALPSRRKAIFVHGCFWHRPPDPDCKLARMPKSRQEFWKPKLARNRARDLHYEDALAASGWGVMTVRECELRDAAFTKNKIRTFLDS